MAASTMAVATATSGVHRSASTTGGDRPYPTHSPTGSTTFVAYHAIAPAATVGRASSGPGAIDSSTGWETRVTTAMAAASTNHGPPRHEPAADAFGPKDHVAHGNGKEFVWSQPEIAQGGSCQREEVRHYNYTKNIMISFRSLITHQYFQYQTV